MFNEIDKTLLMIIVSAGLIALLTTFIVFFLFQYQKKQLINRKEKEQLEDKFQQVLLETVIEIKEQTLQYMSQEIHDNIGQVLILAKLNLNTTNLENPEAANQKISQSKELISKAISDLRDISKGLNTDLITEIGLAQSIQKELATIEKADEYVTNYSQSGSLFRFDKRKELIIFRMAQEILNNIIKHAKAKTITVKLAYSPDLFELAITDDGDGFDISKSQGGLGIYNISNRAKLIGAYFQINSMIGEGTSIYIKLPI